jgi:hypothetical protein
MPTGRKEPSVAVEADPTLSSAGNSHIAHHAAQGIHSTLVHPGVSSASNVCLVVHNDCDNENSTEDDCESGPGLPTTCVATLQCTTRVVVQRRPAKVLHDGDDTLQRFSLLNAISYLQEQLAGLDIDLLPHSNLKPARSNRAQEKAQHACVTDTLAHGRVVHADKRVNPFGHVTYKCLLEHPSTGAR